MRVTVLNGVNLNILVRRDPALYGGVSIAELEGRIYEWSRELGLMVNCRQSNDEGEFIHWIHDAYDNADGLVINPGAWTHYAWSIRDALEIAALPTVEVHLSDVEHREEWRQHSVVRELCVATVSGQGIDGYRAALERVKEELDG
jgi:3-dehydroquinate dehydratase II